MKLSELLTENIKTVSLQQVRDEKLFGPVYHGSTEESRKNISQQGFRVIKDIAGARSEERTHGFQTSDYALGLPAPIHFLGWGVYFTTVKSIAMKFNWAGGPSAKGLTAYYLNTPRIATINFGATGTIMKWWIAHGYDFDWRNIPGERNFANPAVERERVRATDHMTEQLKSQYDAVWYKGKGMYKLLDGDQVCIYEPAGKIFKIDPKLSKGLEVGAQVKIAAGAEEVYLKSYEERFAKEITVKQEGNVRVFYNQNGSPFHRQPLGVKGTIMNITSAPNGKQFYHIKWTKGGTQFNYVESELEALT
jgi:hypothetical protein